VYEGGVGVSAATVYALVVSKELCELDQRLLRDY